MGEVDLGDESGEEAWYSIETVPVGKEVQVYIEREGKKIPFRIKGGELLKIIKLPRIGPLGKYFAEVVTDQKAKKSTVSLNTNDNYGNKVYLRSIP